MIMPMEFVVRHIRFNHKPKYKIERTCRTGRKHIYDDLPACAIKAMLDGCIRRHEKCIVYKDGQAVCHYFGGRERVELIIDTHQYYVWNSTGWKG